MSPRERHDVDPSTHRPAPWPVLEIVLNADGTGSVNGRTVVAADVATAQEELLAEATRYAGVLGRPLRVRAMDPNGVWHLVAHPDGAVTALPDDDPDPRDDDPAPPEDDAYGLETDALHLRVHPSGAITPVEDDEVDLVPPPRAARPSASDDPRPPGPSLLFPTPLEPPPDDEPPDVGSTAAKDVPAEDDAPAEDVNPAEGLARSGATPARWVPWGPSEPEPLPRPEPEADLEAQPEAEPDLEGSVPESEMHARRPWYQPGPLTSDPSDPSDPAAPVDPWLNPTPTNRDHDRAWWSDSAGSGGPDRVDPDSGGPSVDDPDSGGPSVDDPDSGGPSVDDPDSGGPDRDAPFRDLYSGESLHGQVSVDDPLPEVAPRDVPGDDAEHDPGDDPGDDPGVGIVERIRLGADQRLRIGRPRGRASWIALCGGAAALVVLVAYAVGGRGGTSSVPSSASPTASSDGARPIASAPTRPGASPLPSPSLASPPAQLAIGAPPGFGTRPVWGVPLAQRSKTVVLGDGRVLVLVPDHRIALVDPANGALLWQAGVPQDTSAGPYLGTIDGSQVIAVVSPDSLRYWQLPSRTATSSDGGSPTTVALEPGSTVTWAGPSPLVESGGGAGVVRGDSLEPVRLPTGLKPVAADGADVLAVSGNNWIRQTAGRSPAQPRRLGAPSGSLGTIPVRVDTVGGGYLVGMWDGPDGPIAAVYDAHTGALVVQTTFPKDTDFTHALTVREPGSNRTAVGTALIDPGAQNLSILNPSFTPVSLAPGHVYARDISGVYVDLQIKGASIKIIPFGGTRSAVPVGITTVGTRSYALVTTTGGGTTLLCALPPD